MNKVLLINTNIEKYPYPIPPLGICLLSSYLASHYDVKIYDGMFDEGSSLQDLVQEFRPDYIGFSIRNVDDVVADKEIFYPDRILSDFIRPVQAVTNVPIILGGSGFSVFPEELMNLTGADYGIVGDGEKALLELLQRLDQELPVDDLPQVAVKGRKMNLKQISFSSLDYHAVPLSVIDQRIDYSPYRKRGVYSIQTKRGCAMKCIYCTYPGIEGKTYRLRDPDAIAKEIEEAAERLGQVTFEFVDSTFNEPTGHAETICKAIIKRRIRPRLRTMGVNPRNTSRELFELMMEAGFIQIDVTPDSASQSVINNLQKGFTLADIQRTAKLIREFNLPTMWFFLFGGPGETEKTVEETRGFIREFVNQEDMVLMLAGLRIYPNTPLEKIALKEGKIKAGESLFHPSPYYFSSHTPKARLDQLLSEITLEFFNCLSAVESNPTPEMIQKALNMRKVDGLTEPMFRTLLKIRKKHRNTEKRN